MKPSTVEKLKEFDNWVIYKTSCDCLSDDHNLTIFLENFDVNDRLNMKFYINCIVSDHFNVNNDPLFKRLFKTLKNRIYYALKILFTGCIELEQEFLFKDEQHVQDLIDALEEGRERIK